MDLCAIGIIQQLEQSGLDILDNGAMGTRLE